MVPPALHHFLLLDYMHPYPVTEVSSVLVPAYVELNDMVSYGLGLVCTVTAHYSPYQTSSPPPIFISISTLKVNTIETMHYKKESNQIDEVHLNKQVIL